MTRSTNGRKTFVSLLLVFAMLLAMLPMIPMVTGSAATTQTATIYFKDTDGWGSVYGYVWNDDGDLLMGAWPGTQLSKNADGLYGLKVQVPSGSGINFIFNNKVSQTGDLALTAAQVGETYWVSGASGVPTKYRLPSVSGSKITFTYESSTASSVKVAGSFNDWTGATMTKSGSTFTYTAELVAGQYEYKFVVDGNWINDPCNPLTTGADNNNYFIMHGMHDVTVPATKGVACTLPAELSYTATDGSAQLTAVTYTCSDRAVTIDGNTATVSSSYTGSTVALTATNSFGASCTVTLDLTGAATQATQVVLHFSNTLGWGKVCAHVWSSAGTLAGNWPGRAVDKDTDGLYTLVLDHAFAEGESLSFLFHDNAGAQTVDLTVSSADIASGQVERWIQPTGTADATGKHLATVSTTAAGITRPHTFSNGQVTFHYTGSATTVYLAGSFNDWSTTSIKLTKNAKGVWTTTQTLPSGVYEYKYIIDGEWTADPLNGAVGGYDGNSILVVPGTETPIDTGKVTVVLHFYRESGAYTGWDTWFWSKEGSGSAAFKTAAYDKGRVASFTVDGRSNTNVGYTVRKTDWSDKEFYDRFIDISDVVSGTVHYYLNSGSATGSRVLGPDVVMGPKASYANLNYDTGKIWVKLSMPHEGPLSTAFSIVKADGSESGVSVTGVAYNNGGIDLTLSRTLGLGEIADYNVVYNTSTCQIYADGLMDSEKFMQDCVYNGDDLGATWSAASTTFKVWAPTARSVHLKLYRSGNYGAGDQLQYVEMARMDRGVWAVTVTGDLHGIYYNYDITFSTYTVEATDPYADATGANGDRGMVVNFDLTDPTGWDNDVSPDQGMSYTDAIIYEMHVREFTIDSSSGVSPANRGKYLGLIESGTSYNGHATGLDHLKELGVTHVQLMPVFDFNSVDEYHLTDWAQYAWGYDPKNFNVPEGGYSSDPFDGAVRINEFKQMVQGLHSNGINVVMDVVYNHTFDGGNYCGNKILPNYYSRFYGEYWSNGSGVGNDFATERPMVRNLIVDSIMHWVEEYHIDGFRFDLAGLIDTQTVNEIVDTVHAKYPNVLFYGEGWAPGSTAVEAGYALTTKDNAWQVPGFAFFNDNYRNAIGGDNGRTWGFASGSGDFADAIGNYFRASNGWSTTPTQTVNYVACHDNYSLTDKIIISKNGCSWSDMTKMNRLANAMVLLSQGIPLIYSGDELLREKKDGDGNRYDNAYGTDDYINKIRWNELRDKDYAQLTDDYYAGLIEFRKNHAALRCPGGADAWNYTSYYKIDNNCVMFYVDGYPNWECSDGIVIILNGGGDTKWVDLNGKVPNGYYQATIHGDRAGNSALWGLDVTSSSGNVGVEPYSATVLVKGQLVDTNSVYLKNLSLVACDHASHDQSGSCTKCGAAVGHSYGAGAVTKQPTCTAAGIKTFTCSVCGHSYTEAIDILGHSYVDGKCSVCGVADPDYVKPVVQPTLTLNYPSLSFESEIVYNVYFTPTNIEDVVEMGLITFASRLEDGTIADAVDILPNAQSAGTMYMAQTKGIAAKYMGAALYFKVYAKLSDGSYVYSAVAGYNAIAYTNTIFKNSQSDEMKALCVAMLNYGAEAQKFFGHNVDSLMTAGLTAGQQALVSAYDASMVEAVVAVDAAKTGQFVQNKAGFTALKPTVSFEGAFAVNYYFSTAYAPENGMTMYYWTAADYAAADVLTPGNATGSMAMEPTGGTNEYWGAVSDIAAKRLDETIYVTAVYTAGGTTYCTGVIAYHIGRYCQGIAANDSSAMQDLAAATATYGYYAKNYFISIA